MGRLIEASSPTAGVAENCGKPSRFSRDAALRDLRRLEREYGIQVPYTDLWTPAP